MKPRQAVPEKLQQLAELQSGVVSREQVLGHGVSRHVLQRLMDSGAWQPIARSLYSDLGGFSVSRPGCGRRGRSER